MITRPPERRASGRGKPWEFQYLENEVNNQWVLPMCFLKRWRPTTMGFLPTKHDHFGVFWGYHHLRKHPNQVYRLQQKIRVALLVRVCFCVLFSGGAQQNKNSQNKPAQKKHIVEGCGEDVCIGYVGVFLSSSPKGGHRHSEFWVGEPWVPRVLRNFLESLDELVTLFRYMGWLLQIGQNWWNMTLSKTALKNQR